MTNNSWKDTFEQYKIAAKKPQSYDNRYNGVKDKYNILKEEAYTLERNIMAPLSTEHIKFTKRGIEFIVNNKSVWDSSFFNMSHIRNALNKGVDMTRDILSCIITKEIGSFTSNRAMDSYDYLNPSPFVESHHTVTLPILSNLVKEAEEVVNKIDEEFINNAKNVYKEIGLLEERVRRFNITLKNRGDVVQKLKRNVILNWWKEDGSRPGTKLVVITNSGKRSFVGEVESSSPGKKDIIIRFTNGDMVHGSRIDIDWSFAVNYPNVEKGYGSILDI